VARVLEAALEDAGRARPTREVALDKADSRRFREWFGKVFRVQDDPDPLPSLGGGCYAVAWTVLVGADPKRGAGAHRLDLDDVMDRDTIDPATSDQSREDDPPEAYARGGEVPARRRHRAAGPRAVGGARVRRRPL
jgi:hypothetical protein